MTKLKEPNEKAKLIRMMDGIEPGMGILQLEVSLL